MQFSVVALALAVLASANPEWDRGLKHLDNKEYKKAIAVFEPLCRSGALTRENEARCWGNVAEGYLHLRQHDKAIAFANKAIGLGDGASSYSRLGAAYLGKGRHEDAANAFTKAPKASQRFYGFSPAVRACMLESKSASCVQACKEEQNDNDRLRTQACRRGRQALMQRCRDKKDIAACAQRCELKIVPSKMIWLGYTNTLERNTACNLQSTYVWKRARERAARCATGDADSCELTCKEDRNMAACEQGKLLRAGERADRLTKCENRDEVACVTACEIDNNPAACSVLETLRRQTVEKWKSRCEAKDSEACHELGDAYRDGKQGRVVDKNAAAEFFMKACRLGRDVSCQQARAVATPAIMVELETRDCRAGDDGACRKAAIAQIAAGDVEGGTKTLDTRCASDVASCVALGEAVKDKRPTLAESAFRRACERGESGACLTLFDAYHAGTWRPQDEDEADDLYEERCVDVDDTTPRISTCSTMRSRIRSADRRVPGEKGPQVFTFDYGIAALVGVDTNPYRTSRATVNDTLGEDILGFGVYPHAALRLEPYGRVAANLGPFLLDASGQLQTQHLYGVFSESSVSHSGPLNLLAGRGQLQAGLRFFTQRLQLSLRNTASATLSPGVQMPIALHHPDLANNLGPTALTLQVPYGGGVYGDVMLREENLLKGAAVLDLGLLSAQVRYRFQLTRVSLTRAIEDATGLAALVDPARLGAPGATAVQAGLLDEHRHRVGARVGLNLEDLLDLEANLYADVSGGFEQYYGGQYIPGSGRLGLAFSLDDGFVIDINAGFAVNDVPSQNFATWVGDAFVTVFFDDGEASIVTGGLTRFLTTHPTIAYTVVNGGLLSYQMRVDDMTVRLEGTLGVLDLGPTTVLNLAPAQGDTNFFSSGKAFVDVPVGFGSLAARVGGEVEFLDPSITAQAPGLDVAPGASIGYGRVGLFGGISY